MRAPSGRQRFNVLGALNAVTHQLVTVTNESYINSASVGELLEKIATCEIAPPDRELLFKQRVWHAAAQGRRSGCHGGATTACAHRCDEDWSALPS